MEKKITAKPKEKKMGFKANPIRKYVPLPIIKKRAPTIPKSPNITKGRQIKYVLLLN